MPGMAAKIPVLLVVGKREAEEKKVSIRRLGSEKQTVMGLDEAITALVEDKGAQATAAALSTALTLQSGQVVALGGLRSSKDSDTKHRLFSWSAGSSASTQTTDLVLLVHAKIISE